MCSGSLAALLQQINLPTIAELEELIPDGPRDSSTLAEYTKLEQLFLPILRLDIFWDNFSAPGLIFATHKSISQNLAKVKPPVESARIAYMALWDGEDDESKSLELNIEVDVLLEVVDSFDSVAYTDWSSDADKDPSIEDQLRECGNMFNFSFIDIDVEDEGVFENDWEIENPLVELP